MARKNLKPKSYFEPWTAQRSSTWDLPYRFGPPTRKDLSDAENAEVTLNWESAKQRAMEDAPWIVWGSGMTSPTVICDLSTGVASVTDDKGIIGVTKTNYLPKGAPDQEAFTTRMVECVNAMAHVAEPEAFMKDLRAMLLYCCRGDYQDDPREDPRIVSLLGRCIPPDELKGALSAESDGNADSSD